MNTYYITTSGTETTHSETWNAAKKLATAALKSRTYPIEIEQRTMIDGRSPHRRVHVCIQSSDDVQRLVKSNDRWECIDSFYSHVKPSANA